MADYYTTRLEEIDGEIAAAQAAVNEINEAMASIHAQLADMETEANTPADQLQASQIVARVHARQRLEVEGPALRRALRDLEKRRTTLYVQALGPGQRRRQAVAAEAALPARAVDRCADVLANLEAMADGSNGSKHSDELLKLSRSVEDGLRGAAQLLKL